MNGCGEETRTITGLFSAAAVKYRNKVASILWNNMGKFQAWGLGLIRAALEHHSVYRHVCNMKAADVTELDIRNYYKTGRHFKAKYTLFFCLL